MPSPIPFRVIPCSEWKAVAPKGAIVGIGRPERSIFHHTAGHVPHLSAGETYAEACAYARAIQRAHMAPGGLGAPHGGIDSGHNYLITRGGFILEGRHGSHAALRAGRMVASAHCPNQNDQPGIEHEHNGTEGMTAIQRQASVWLHADICRWTHMSPVTIMQPHRRYFATSCPGSLERVIPNLRAAVVAELRPDTGDSSKWWDKYGPKQKPEWLWPLLADYQRRLEG